MGFSTAEIAMMAAAGGAVAATALAPTPHIPAPPAPEVLPESQAAKAPDTQEVLKTQNGMGQSGGSPGVAQTFLTGAGGIDPKSLSLTKSTLLG